MREIDILHTNKDDENLENINEVNEILRNKGDILFYVYADYCGYCNEFMETWDDFLDTIFTDYITDATFVKIEKRFEHKLDKSFTAPHFPYIVFYEKDKIKEVFNEKRTVENLLDFLKKNNNLSLQSGGRKHRTKKYVSKKTGGRKNKTKKYVSKKRGGRKNKTKKHVSKKRGGRKHKTKKHVSKKNRR